jgi:hypothetical protein
MRSLLIDLAFAAVFAAAAVVLVRAPRWLLFFVVIFLRLRFGRALLEETAAAAERGAAVRFAASVPGSDLRPARCSGSRS